MENIIQQFYNAFSTLDAENMNACYHDEIVFEDPIFGILKGERVKNMWKMLSLNQKDKDFKLNLKDIQLDDFNGSAEWEAQYIYRSNGKKLYSLASSIFEIKDGKIIKQVDYFNLNDWAKQAVGLKGAIVGSTSFFKNKISDRLISKLNDYENGTLKLK